MDSLKVRYDAILNASKKLRSFTQPFLSCNQTAQPGKEGLPKCSLQTNVNSHTELTLQKPTTDPSCSEQSSLLLASVGEEMGSLYQQTYARVSRELAVQVIPNSQLKMTPSSKRICDEMKKQYNAKMARAKHTILKPLSSHTSKSPRGHFFDQHNITLLERYFARNPYPCASERRSLAKKCHMSPKQIDIWFQNRRSRTKKDRSTRLQTPPAESSHTHGRKSSNFGAHVLQPKPVLQYAKSRRTEGTDISSSSNPLDDPFPPGSMPTGGQTQPLRFSPSLWRRRPNRRPNTSSPEPVQIDVEALIDQLSQMSVRGDMNSKKRRCWASCHSALSTNLRFSPQRYLVKPTDRPFPQPHLDCSIIPFPITRASPSSRRNVFLSYDSTSEPSIFLSAVRKPLCHTNPSGDSQSSQRKGVRFSPY